ncbi:MAG: PAS domain S-box protein, partial [Terriglobales bacterium]
MRAHFPISFQAWTLVLVPLVAQLSFIAVLASQMHQVEIERDEEAQSQEVQRHVTALSRLLMTTIQAALHWDVVRGKKGMPGIYELAPKLKAETEKLEELTGVFPAQHAVLMQMQADYQSFRATDAKIKAALKEGDQITAVKEASHLRKGLNELFATLNSILLDQQRIGDEKQQAQIKYRERVQQVLAIGVVFNILLAFSMVIAFNKGLGRQLRTLMDNTVRLARGQELSPPLADENELSRLDRVFRDMAASISDTTRRERAVLETAADVICTIDEQGELTRTNPALQRLSGLSAAELSQHPFEQLLVVDDQPATHTLMQQLKSGQSEGFIENRLATRGGAEVEMLWSIRWSAEQSSFFCVGRN